MDTRFNYLIHVFFLIILSENTFKTVFTTILGYVGFKTTDTINENGKYTSQKKEVINLKRKRNGC